ncbi:MAG: selenide, water dikinase SelD [Solirubrobacterales bacterium]
MPDAQAAPGEIALTSLSHGAGCACKIGAEDLSRLVAGVPFPTNEELLVGLDARDDAAVYRLTDEVAVVLTSDFFTPIVDDPYEFGRIAATNALSDIYAMGATPKVAINLLAASVSDLGYDVPQRILRGGADAAAGAGIALGGGHSIDDAEPKYGLAVVGTVHPDEILTNAGAEAGDALVLTKPIGSGLVTTASKKGLASGEVLDAAIEVMTTLNADAAAHARDAGAHALTDVTGFGLLGHSHELAEASGLAARIDADSVPAIAGALELAADERCVAGGTRRNIEHAEGFTRWNGTRGERRILLADAMTSGGLLVAVPPSAAERIDGALIGELVAGPAGDITVS